MTGAPAEGTDSDYAGGAKGVDEIILHKSYKPLKLAERFFGRQVKAARNGAVIHVSRRALRPTASFHPRSRTPVPVGDRFFRVEIERPVAFAYVWFHPGRFVFQHDMHPLTRYRQLAVDG